MGNIQRVPVALGAASYDIYIGQDLREEILRFLKNAPYTRRALIISDTNVAKLYAGELKEILEEAGFQAELAVVPAGEETKNLRVAEQLFTQAIKAGLDRKSPIFALGGGVVGDLAGFIAASYMRGVPFLQVPTSLLAQVDSSVGGKVAVNHALGKNLIGAFYQPDAVFMDMKHLKTLPKREIATGLGEIVKYGLIADADFYEYLEANAQNILELEEEPLRKSIVRSCEIKAEVVSKDEKEGGLRRILNFGHTLAHAIEQETKYARYNHGEAVAIGMVGALHISAALKLLDGKEILRAEKLLTSLRLPIRAEGCTVEAMQENIYHDKKTVGGKVQWVLLDAVGSVAKEKDAPAEIVCEAMRAIRVSSGNIAPAHFEKNTNGNT